MWGKEEPFFFLFLLHFSGRKGAYAQKGDVLGAPPYDLQGMHGVVCLHHSCLFLLVFLYLEINLQCTVTDWVHSLCILLLRSPDGAALRSCA